MFFKVVPNCISDSACEHIIQFSESIGFNQSTLNGVLNTDFRNSFSCKLKDNWLSEQDSIAFKQHIASYLPKEYQGKKFVDVTISNLNILKYGSGNYFKPHTDGTFVDKSKNSKSLITVQIYLNDCPSGGETNFFNKDGTLAYSLKPKKGTVAFFDHMILHEGAEVKEGLKYTFRINAMYEN